MHLRHPVGDTLAVGMCKGHTHWQWKCIVITLAVEVCRRLHWQLRKQRRKIQRNTDETQIDRLIQTNTVRPTHKLSLDVGCTDNL